MKIKFINMTQMMIIRMMNVPHIHQTMELIYVYSIEKKNILIITFHSVKRIANTKVIIKLISSQYVNAI